MQRNETITITVQGPGGMSVVSSVNGYGEAHTSYFKDGGLYSDTSTASQSFRTGLMTFAANIAKEYDPEGVLR